MRRPKAVITVNGRPVSSIFNERLISVTITDKEGVTSDTIALELDDGRPFAEIPQKGDIIEAWLGYEETGLASFGRFTAEDPEVRCLPYGMTVNGKGADMREKLKQHSARHWDNKSLKDILGDIAAPHGLQVRVDQALGAHLYEWFAQQDESDLHVVERLARRHGALFSVKGGALVFAKKGTGESASGAALQKILAYPGNIVEGTCRTTFAHRAKFKKVKARVQDRKQAKAEEEEADSDSEGSADYTLPDPYADKAEAKSAAKAKAKDLKAETIRTSVTLIGDPAVRGGAPFGYQDVRPGLDELEFIIESATHRYAKSGYMVDVSAKLKPDA